MRNVSVAIRACLIRRAYPGVFLLDFKSPFPIARIPFAVCGVRQIWGWDSGTVSIDRQGRDSPLTDWRFYTDWWGVPVYDRARRYHL